MKKINFIAAIVVAFLTVTVKAQSVVSNVSTSDFKACKEYLTTHPTDTIRSEKNLVVSAELADKAKKAGQSFNLGDTVSCVVKVFKTADGKIARNVSYKKTIVEVASPCKGLDFELASQIDRKAEETQFTYNLSADRRKDVIGYKSDDVREAYKDVRGNAGVVVEKAADKDGWSVEAQASYQVAEDCNAFGGSLGLAYTGSWWQVYVNGGVTRTLYTENANRAGENYWAYKAESGLLLQPFKFDRFDQNRLFIGGGCGWEHYNTDSQVWTGDDGQIYDLSSRGNYMYLHGDIKFEHRFFATGNSLYAKLQVREKKFIYQNADAKSKLAFEFAVGMNLGIFRHRINNK